MKRLCWDYFKADALPYTANMYQQAYSGKKAAHHSIIGRVLDGTRASPSLKNKVTEYLEVVR
jgi:hypothetical protein